jgi:ASCH domain
MNALTLKPQYAELVVRGEKTVENRSIPLRLRGKIAIHRGGPGGALVAAADMADIVTPGEALRPRPDQREHICGPWCWLLDNVQKIEPPIPCSGRLGLWKASDAVAQELEARLR